MMKNPSTIPILLACLATLVATPFLSIHIAIGIAELLVIVGVNPADAAPAAGLLFVPVCAAIMGGSVWIGVRSWRRR